MSPTVLAADSVCTTVTNDTFFVNSDTNVDSYFWTVPTGASIVSGQGDTLIVVDWSGASQGIDSVCVFSINACDTSNPVCIGIEVFFLPTTAAAGSDSTVCSSSYTLAGNNPAIGSGSWSLVSGSASITTPSQFNTTVTALGQGPNVFRWTTANGPCATSSDDVTITRDTLPINANAGADIDTCDVTSVQMAANSPGVSETGTWSIVSGAATITTPNSPTTSITGLSSNATVVLRWTISTQYGVCASTSDDMTIRIDETASVANAGTDIDTCDVTSVQLAANSVGAGETGTWTVVSGTATITSPNSPTTSITGLVSNTTVVMRWTITTLYGICVSTADDVTIRIDETVTTANAGSDIDTCDVTSVQMAANAVGAGETGTWTLISGSAFIIDPNDETTAIAGISSNSTVVLRWTITTLYGICPSSFDDVTIRVDETATVANSGADIDTCDVSSIQLSANTAGPGETGTWSVVSGTATITSPNSPTSSITGLVSNTTVVMRWTITTLYGICASTQDDVTIRIDETATVANAGTDIDTCDVTSLNLAGNAVGPGETGTWTVVSGTATITSPNSPTTSITGLVSNTTVVMRWTITTLYGICASTQDDVTIRIDETATVSNAGADIDTCDVTSVQLAGNSVGAGETGTWSVVSGTATITSPNSPTTSITGLVSNTTVVMRWTITTLYGICASTQDDVTIRIDETATVSN
ncbi:MAG: hypothetical protein HKN92_07315, partial [Chitinophagales bacterium]|nr:hypothetical protein [Chitinophagales bacterium]